MNIVKQIKVELTDKDIEDIKKYGRQTLELPDHSQVVFEYMKR